MTSNEIKIYQSGQEPVKVFTNSKRPGVILRQSKSYIFLDREIAQEVLDVVANLLDELATP